MTGRWKLYLDDVRTPVCPLYKVARSSSEALALCKEYGMPHYMSLDHDLGGEDTTMVFLKGLYAMFPTGPIPDYWVHSANPVGKENIISYLESWKKSLTM